MDFIVNPFTTLLVFLYSIFNDMVLAIAVFTILIRLLTYPLTAQQMRSSAAMQKLQPELKKLQEKYKNDREALAQEQMKLYREAGINPLGGCLPLLIQFPIFIALYQAILHALASTPTQLLDLSGRLLIPGMDRTIPLNNIWLGMNLTQPPNFNAGGLPMIMGALLVFLTFITTWIQFKVTMPQTPPSADGKPDQAQQVSQSMGTIMPVMYAFFALSFSIGLSIYFIVSNVAGILQYSLMGKANWRNLFARPQPAPAAVQAKASSGRTAAKPKPSSSSKAA
ncbi:MAG: YidC/Oxa1 family membrane protein insertase, partial [Anaerolinea sp.]|nr:YidC/Oxa1 family membrane protein insertase [Anaerolinea sp.]